MCMHTDELKRAKQNITVHNEHLDEMFVCIFLNTHIGVINMSVLLALAIILAVIAVAIRRNANVKATSVVATTEVVAAAVVAPSVAHTQDVCDPINDYNAVDYSVMITLVCILMYTKTSLKAHKRHVRTVQGKLAHKAACAHIRAQREARSNAMGYVTSANIKAVARADERKACVS